MDRNTVIGFILIGLLMMGMFYFNSQGSKAYQAEQQRIADSLAKLQPKVDSLQLKKDSAAAAGTRLVNAAGSFQGSLQQTETITSVENNLLKISFSNKGAQPRRVELKNFKDWKGQPVVMQSGDFNKLAYTINSGDNRTISTSELLFNPGELKTEADKSQVLSFTLKDSAGRALIHRYTIREGDYRIGLEVILQGAPRLVTGNQLKMQWAVQLPRIEKDITYERQQTELGYFDEGKFDFERLATGGDYKSEGKVNWLAVKQQFFVNALIGANPFNDAAFTWTVPKDTVSHVVGNNTASLSLALPAGENVSLPLQLYYGPSDYSILKSYGNHMQELVPYGSGIFAFVKYINRHILLPVFDFLRQHVASMGIVVLLLTLFIRLLTSPILYKSYLSGAKMKALKPEVDALRAKFTDKKGELDQQAFSMEQMKLWRSAGVSPFGGCVPALLQIPIFMSLYYFFQSNISLRGQSFLWAKDLAAYDSIYNFSFNIPLYGDHVSLFTLTATVTSLLISLYSMSNMQDNSNPVMKYMPYIFPVMLLGVFNSLPSALTWYYTVSNTITLILQFVIQQYIIDHDKIVTQLEENRKKPVKQSKWQERLQQMQETQKKMQEEKRKQQGR